jgi:hypothetical protein
MNPTYENEPRTRVGTGTREDHERESRPYRVGEEREHAYSSDEGYSHYEKHRDLHKKSSAELERDIDRTRDRIEARARLLEERLSPTHLFEQVWDRLRGGGANEFVTNLGRDVRDHPLPLLLTGVGIAWLMRTDVRRRGELYVEYDEHDPMGYRGRYRGSS